MEDVFFWDGVCRWWGCWKGVPKGGWWVGLVGWDGQRDFMVERYGGGIGRREKGAFCGDGFVMVGLIVVSLCYGGLGNYYFLSIDKKKREGEIRRIK